MQTQDPLAYICGSIVAGFQALGGAIQDLHSRINQLSAGQAQPYGGYGAPNLGFGLTAGGPQPWMAQQLHAGAGTAQEPQRKRKAPNKQANRASAGAGADTAGANAGKAKDPKRVAAGQKGAEKRKANLLAKQGQAQA